MVRLRDQMPDLDGAVKWLNSKPLGKADVIGNKPTFIHFWSVSCNKCKQDMPEINRLRDEYKEHLHVIAVHMPRSEEDLNVGQVRSIAKQNSISHPIHIDSEYKLTDAFRIKFVPAYFIFDSEGKLRHSQGGGGGLNLLKKRIDRIVNQKNK